MVMVIMVIVFSNMFRFSIENYPVYLIIGQLCQPVIFAWSVDTGYIVLQSAVSADAFVCTCSIGAAVFLLLRGRYASFSG